MNFKISFFIFFIFFDCYSQIKIDSVDTTKKIDLKTLDKYKEELKNAKENYIIILNKSKPEFISYFYKNYEQGYNLDEYDSKKIDDSRSNRFKQTIIKYDNSIDVIEKIDNNFDSYKSYYSNGNIKSEVVSSWLGFGKSKSYKYDENGKITEMKDWDEGYKFTYVDVFAFLNKKEIKTCKLCMTKIYKITNNGKKTWVVEFQDYTIKKTVTFVLDAIDGTILNKTENNLPVRICGDSQN
jgi:hypothetical protein